MTPRRFAIGCVVATALLGGPWWSPAGPTPALAAATPVELWNAVLSINFPARRRSDLAIGLYQGTIRTQSTNERVADLEVL